MKNTSNNMNKYKESDFMKNEFIYQAGILDAPFLKTEAMNKIYSN